MKRQESVRCVDVVTQRIGVVELFVTDRTCVVMERQVLGQCGNCLELCVAVGAGLRHCIINSD